MGLLKGKKAAKQKTPVPLQCTHSLSLLQGCECGPAHTSPSSSFIMCRACTPPPVLELAFLLQQQPAMAFLKSKRWVVWSPVHSSPWDAQGALSAAIFIRKSRPRSHQCSLQGDLWKRSVLFFVKCPAVAGCHVPWTHGNSKPPQEGRGSWVDVGNGQWAGEGGGRTCGFAARSWPDKACLGHIFPFNPGLWSLTLRNIMTGWFILCQGKCPPRKTNYNIHSAHSGDDVSLV